MAPPAPEKKPDPFSAEYLVKEYVRRNAKAEHISGRRHHEFGLLYQKGLDAALAKAKDKYKVKSTDEIHIEQIKKDKELMDIYKNTIIKGHEDLAIAASKVQLDKLGDKEDADFYKQELLKIHSGGHKSDLRAFLSHTIGNAKTIADLYGANVGAAYAGSDVHGNLKKSLGSWQQSHITDAINAKDAKTVAADIAKYIKLDKHLRMDLFDNYQITLPFVKQFVLDKKEPTRQDLEQLVGNIAQQDNGVDLRHLLKPEEKKPELKKAA